jgi:hypothetical protein
VPTLDHTSLAILNTFSFIRPICAQIGVTWYLLPLALAISLVYSASRYELPERILSRAIRLFITIIVCMGAVLALLWFLSYGL